MADNYEFEMLLNVMRAQVFIRNAEGWLKRDPVTAGRLGHAKATLQLIVDACTEENKRLADMQVFG